jgi:FlaA1/EpsC-like NDP-sugar epimerase
VLVTFALLVQFGSFLSDVERNTAALPSEGSLLKRTFFVNRRRLIEVVVDFALVTASFFAAYLLRVGSDATVNQRAVFIAALPVVLAARYLVFIPLGLYKGVWRYAGARDAARIVTAVVVSEVLAIGFLAATRPWGDFPRSIFLIDVLVCTPLIGASRFWERAAIRGLSSLRDRGERKRTLIVGAGRSGRSLLRELRETPGERVIGFVDDDPSLWRRRLQGVPVLGSCDEAARIVLEVRPDQVFVTIPAAPRERLDFVSAACAQNGVALGVVRREIDTEPLVAFESTE